MPVYGTRQAAYRNDNRTGKFKDVRLAPGDGKVAFAAPPAESALPKEAKEGDVLVGSASVCRSQTHAEGPSRRPAADLWYYVPPRSKNTKDKKAAPKKKNETEPLVVDAAAAGRARALLGDALSAGLDDAASVKLANATADAHVSKLKKEASTLEDAAFEALGAAVVAYGVPSGTPGVFF